MDGWRLTPPGCLASRLVSIPANGLKFPCYFLQTEPPGGGVPAFLNRPPPKPGRSGGATSCGRGRQYRPASSLRYRYQYSSDTLACRTARRHPVVKLPQLKGIFHLDIPPHVCHIFRTCSRRPAACEVPPFNRSACGQAGHRPSPGNRARIAPWRKPDTAGPKTREVRKPRGRTTTGTLKSSVGARQRGGKPAAACCERSRPRGRRFQDRSRRKAPWCWPYN